MSKIKESYNVYSEEQHTEKDREIIIIKYNGHHFQPHYVDDTKSNFEAKIEQRKVSVLRTIETSLDEKFRTLKGVERGRRNWMEKL